MMPFMSLKTTTCVPYLSVALLLCGSVEAFAKGPVYADPQATDADYLLQGEYIGMIDANGTPTRVAAQIVALGEGEFEVIGFYGGLPGDGWNLEKPARVTAQAVDGTLTAQSEHAKAIVRDGKLDLMDLNGQKLGTLTKTERRSPTLGKKPPENGIVLFDGSSTEAWEKAQVTPDGLLVQGVTSRQKFGSHRLHVEFRLPYQPQDRGQARGNSGVYLQGRYEVQVLDSFGLEGKDNEAGGIYEIQSPKLNMCFPPLTWQTYDIEFTAAKYDDKGMVVILPRISVWHNGVLVQENVELPRATRAAPLGPGAEDGPLYLQDHGNPIRFRNVWVVPVDESAAGKRPGLNDAFLSPTLQVAEWVERFEGESREVFTARDAVMKAIGIRAGDRIADVGAGTGLYSRLFAREVGPNGWVYAVDISPSFLQHIAKSASELSLNNITPVLCDNNSTSLPPGSVDIVFVCDTYHHFEFPSETVQSVFSALKSGGTFVVIDFERVPGVSREWTLDHVRAGKETFRAEIESVGFRFDSEVKLEGFQENYFLKFRKP